jgi:hypothetical protein
LAAGQGLTLEQTAQLLELDTKEMAARSRMAAALLDQEFRLSLTRTASCTFFANFPAPGDASGCLALPSCSSNRTQVGLAKVRRRA